VKLVDLREFLFDDVAKQKWVFRITSRENGIFSGGMRLGKLAVELGLEVIQLAVEGDFLQEGSCVLQALGKTEAVIRSEEMLLGVVGKTSGIATAARNFVAKAGKDIKVICGAWKKVAPEIRDDLRRAIATGGAGIRITDQPFVYLDKNYVRILGGIGKAVLRAKAYEQERIVAVQIRGETGLIAAEALEAYQAGAGIIMVDTGKIPDLAAVVAAAERGGWRAELQIAFAGGIKEKDLQSVIDAGADLVDVGRMIIDAPLLDLSLDIVKRVK
jgi:nicotinate-nucleotide pyrophosphorylase (carboxylating)